MGIIKAIEAILASPQFLFRVEESPARLTNAAYRIADYELASRLSFFLAGRGPDAELLKADAVLALDEALAHYNEQLPRLQEFILPAGVRAAALAHVARTVARRAERAVVTLAGQETINAAPRQYLNRLSDLINCCKSC